MISSRLPLSCTVLAAAMAVAACTPRATGTPLLPAFGQIRDYRIPWENAFPNDIVVDTAGRVWFTDRINHAIGMLDPVSGSITRFPTPTRRSAPYSIVAAPDGGLWFAQSVANRLGRIDPATGEIREVDLGGGHKGPNILASGGGAIWFTLRDDGAIGRLDLASGEARVVKVEGRPYGITIAPDGTAWYGVAQGTALYSIDNAMTPVRREMNFDDFSLIWRGGPEVPDSVRRRVQAMEAARGGDMRRLQTDRSGRIWYADYGRGLVSYDPATTTARIHRLLEGPASTYGLAITRDGQVWYSASPRNEMHVLNPYTGERARVVLPTERGTMRHVFVDERRRQVWLPVSDRGIIVRVEYR